MAVKSFTNSRITRKARTIFNGTWASKSWAAKQLGVSNALISKWMRGAPNELLDREMPRLAQMITETNGRCIIDRKKIITSGTRKGK